MCGFELFISLFIVSFYRTKWIVRRVRAIKNFQPVFSSDIACDNKVFK